MKTTTVSVVFAMAIMARENFFHTTPVGGFNYIPMMILKVLQG